MNGKNFSLSGATYYIDSDDGIQYRVAQPPGRSKPRIETMVRRTNSDGTSVTYWRRLKENSQVAAQLTNQLAQEVGKGILNIR